MVVSSVCHIRDESSPVCRSPSLVANSPEGKKRSHRRQLFTSPDLEVPRRVAGPVLPATGWRGRSVDTYPRSRWANARAPVVRSPTPIQVMIASGARVKVAAGSLGVCWNGERSATHAGTFSRSPKKPTTK